jgi:uncharacterized protein YjbJ (UPF0337 family)
MGLLDRLLGRAKETASDVAEKAGPVVDQAVDKAGELAGQAKEAVGGFAEKHGDSVKDGVTRAGDFVDEKTGGKAAGVVDTVQDTAHEAVDALRGGDGDAAAEAGADAADQAADAGTDTPPAS